MQFTFSEALRTLGSDAAFRLINAARPAASYLFNQFLPERNMTGYEVKSGSMTVRSTMAGLVGMDSPYPESGVIEQSTFLEQSAKLATSADLPERALRAMQDIVMRLQLGGGNANAALAEEVMNFTQALLVQPHLDALEYLRGMALSTGGIDWTFNQKRLLVDYGVPAANILPARTGTAGYGGTASVFWSDVQAIRKALKYNLRAIVLHPETLDMAITNAANNMQVLSQTNTMLTVRKMIAQNGTNTPSSDARDTVSLIPYGAEAEIFDLATPGATVKVPFMPQGKMVGIGNNAGTQYVVGAGSRTPVEYEVGYTHVAPTVEGNGQPGRWARVFTPEGRPWALTGQAVTNALPVIEAPEKIVIATTAMV